MPIFSIESVTAYSVVMETELYLDETRAVRATISYFIPQGAPSPSEDALYFVCGKAASITPETERKDGDDAEQYAVEIQAYSVSFANCNPRK